jgi:hypothetical protein
MDEFWTQHATDPLTCEALRADAAGGLKLSLSLGHTLTVFPASTCLEEHWRCFHSGGTTTLSFFPAEHSPAPGEGRSGDTGRVRHRPRPKPPG